MYISVCVYIAAHRLYAKLRVPGAEGSPRFTAPFTGRARLKFPDPKPFGRSRARRRGASGRAVLPSEEREPCAVGRRPLPARRGTAGQPQPGPGAAGPAPGGRAGLRAGAARLQAGHPDARSDGLGPLRPASLAA